jgi:chaperonin GroEL (HSP60 family)
MAELALEAVMCVAVDNGDGTKEVDIKKYAKIEKIAGGSIEDCRVLKGVMMNKVGLMYTYTSCDSSLPIAFESTWLVPFNPSSETHLSSAI